MATNTPPRSKPQPATPSVIYVPTSPESIAMMIEEEDRYARERQFRLHNLPVRLYANR